MKVGEYLGRKQNKSGKERKKESQGYFGVCVCVCVCVCVREREREREIFPETGMIKLL